MRNKILTLSFFHALLAAMLCSLIAIPTFASGDDKPAKPAPTATSATSTAPASTATSAPSTTSARSMTRADREKKVYTNDDIDRMWPKAQAATDVRTVSANASAPAQARRPVSGSQMARATSVPAIAEQNPVWYAAQLESLYAELDSISSREASLRDFRATGNTDPGVTIGLQFDAACEGITTDNAIEQLAIRRQEIEQQIDALQDTAQQNDVSPAVFQNPQEVLQAAQRPLSPGQERAVLIERQSDLIGQYDGVQNQLADMSDEAAAQGITLLPVTPNWGGNLTTNRIQSLDQLAQQIQDALSENEEAARRAGLAPSALP
jgi:hypothetical protein